MKKKMMMIFLCTAMVLSFSGCGEVKKLQSKIEEIGEVTLDDGILIEEAENSYAELSDTDKKKVENYETLTEARKTYDILVVEENKRIAYEEGQQAFTQKDYATAVDKFAEAGNYEDAKVQQQEAEKGVHYQKALVKIEEKDLPYAVSEFIQADGFEDSKDQLKTIGIQLLEEKDYTNAKKAIKEAEFEEQKDYIHYIEGIEAFEAEKYSEAQASFKNASAVKESEDMLNKCLLMDAKEKMDKGHLNQAKAVLEKLPSDCSYKKVKAGSLLKKINKYKDFLPICGYWTTSDMKSMIMQTSKTTGSWNSWEGNTSGQHLLITCTIGSDGRVTITASVDYWVYTNFSVLSSNLKTKDSVKFLVDVTDRLPDKIVGDDSCLTLSPGNFYFEFNLVDPDASLNFDYTWKCTATFNKLKEAY